MKNKACIFVDGENLRHALVKSFDGDTDFEKHHYLPSKAKWDRFFDWIVEEATNGACCRLRTYWYVIERVDYSPFNLDKCTDQKFASILRSYETMKSELSVDRDLLPRKLKVLRERLEKERGQFQKRFDGWQAIQRGIASKNHAVEFRRSGTIQYNCIEKKLGQEKTVDVKLAVDMVMLRDIYDTAIILSGDQDYVPAAQILKDCGKSVVNVAFEKRNGNLLPGGARYLNVCTDKSFNVTYANLTQFMGITQNISKGLTALKSLA